MNRRQFALSGLVLLPPAATAALAAAAGPAEFARSGQDADALRSKKGSRTRIVTRTFKNPQPFVMNELGPASPYQSTIKVSGLTRGRVLDVNVALHDFTHEYPGDVDILLVSPGGRAAIVMSDAGSHHPIENLKIGLDDQAGAPLPEDDPLTNGTYRPANYKISETNEFPAPAPQNVTNTKLSVFRGINPNGRWKLFIVDDADSDDGIITAGWSLTIKARISTRT